MLALYMFLLEDHNNIMIKIMLKKIMFKGSVREKCKGGLSRKEFDGDCY